MIVFACILLSLVDRLEAFIVSQPTPLSPLGQTTQVSQFSAARKIRQVQKTHMSCDVSPFCVVPDTLVEAEVLNDLSHVALDLGTFLGFNSGLSARLANVVGRILLMVADFLPDHHINTDDLIFQIPLFLLACRALTDAAIPWIRSHLNDQRRSYPSPRDGRAYKSLFQPTGISWRRFLLLRHDVLDWTNMSPGSVIAGETSHYMYWLYRGEIEIHSNLELVHSIQRHTNNPGPAGIGLIGEELLMDTLDLSYSESRGLYDSGSSSSNSSSSKTRPAVTVKVGEEGALLLRIDVSKVAQLVQHDEDLEHSMRLLVLQGMREKIHSYCYAKADSELFY